MSSRHDGGAVAAPTLRHRQGRASLQAMRTPDELQVATDHELVSSDLALSPFKTAEWRSLSPAERLERAWALRRRLPDPQAAHDRKLFPAP